MKRANLLWFGAGVLIAALFVVIWDLTCRFGGISPVFLPSPLRVWHSLVSGFENGVLVRQTFSTLYRMLLGWGIAVIAGIAIGVPLGLSARARQYVQPLLELLRPLPASAMAPVAISILGLSDAMVLAVIVFGSLWPMLLNTLHGVSTIEPRLTEVRRILGLSRAQFIKSIAIPNAIPGILAGMKLSLSIALILTVVGEMLSSRPGLGQGILFASRSFRSADLFAGLVCLGVIGYLTAAILSAVEKRVLFYR
jgi:sulfonate transport system permease protein